MAIGNDTGLVCNLQTRSGFMVMLAKIKNDITNQVLFSRRLNLEGFKAYF